MTLEYTPDNIKKLSQIVVSRFTIEQLYGDAIAALQELYKISPILFAQDDATLKGELEADNFTHPFITYIKIKEGEQKTD